MCCANQPQRTGICLSGFAPFKEAVIKPKTEAVKKILHLILDKC